MTLITTTRRPGISLMEAMIAIGVMAIGLLSLLTLFPLGAVQIGAALKDDRCSEAALQADAYMRAYWKRTVVEALDAPDPTPPTVRPGVTEPFYWALDDPNLQLQKATANPPLVPEIFENQYYGTQNLPTAPPGFTVPQAPPAGISSTGLVRDQHATPTPAGLADPPPANSYYVTREVGVPATDPSYPVMIDPIGFNTWVGSGSQRWVAYANNPSPANAPILIPRRNLAGIGLDGNLAVRVCSLTDDLTFEPDGQPTGPSLSRQGRYTWAAIVQRPDNTAKDAADLTILVFDRRPPLVKLDDSERVVTTNLSVGQTSLTLSVPPPTDPNALPIVRRGGWIMDGTITPGPGGIRHAKFYRIATIDSTTPNVFQVDLETPIEDTVPNAQLYLFEGLAEVFRRPPLPG